MLNIYSHCTLSRFEAESLTRNSTMLGHPSLC